MKEEEIVWQFDKFEDFVSFLIKELNVKEKQVLRSLSSASALKGINLDGSSFEVVPEDDPKLFQDQCGGRLPSRMFHILVIQRKYKARREATIYNSEYSRNGVVRYKITTSPRKEVKPQVRYPTKRGWRKR